VRIATIITTMHNTDYLLLRGIQVTSLIIEFDDDTLAMVDTGMVDNPEFLKQLEEIGYHPSDFCFVFNTHLHPDHIGGNRYFTNARIIISNKEFTYHSSLEAACSVSSQVPDIPEDPLMRKLREIREKYPVADLIGDPGQIEFLEDHPRLPNNIKLIPAPGHSIDDHAIFLPGQTHNVLATGDALYHRDLWHGPTLPGLNYDEDLFRQSARRLSEFHGIIVPGHDLAFDNVTHAYLEINTFISR